MVGPVHLVERGLRGWAEACLFPEVGVQYTRSAWRVDRAQSRLQAVAFRFLQAAHNLWPAATHLGNVTRFIDMCSASFQAEIDEVFHAVKTALQWDRVLPEPVLGPRGYPLMGPYILQVTWLARAVIVSYIRFKAMLLQGCLIRSYELAVLEEEARPAIGDEGVR